MIAAHRYLGSVAIFAALLLSATVTLPTTRASAQESGAPLISLAHSPLAPDAIPPLGSPMHISFILLGTKDVSTKVRLVGSKDGRYMDITFPYGALNRQDRAEFSLDIPSPVAGMSYQFVIHQPNGTLTTSQQYTAQRPCVQNFTVEAASDDPGAAFQREIASLESKAARLKQDTDSLEASVKLVEELRATINQTSLTQ